MASSEFAVTFTAREQAELLAVDPPTVPLEPRQVHGRTLATLVSAGTEIEGAYLGERFPVQPGYAAVFEVTGVGEEVASIRPGDHVFCMGNHRSFQRVAEPAVLPVPAGLAPTRAVFARLMNVTMTTLTTTTARPPERVAVTGLGLVGHLGAQNLRVAGYDVLGVDPDPRRREIAAGKGLAVAERLPTGDEAGFGLVLDGSGHEQAVLDACQAVRPKGEVVLVGTPWRRRTELTAHAILWEIFHRYVVVRSGWEWELPREPQAFRVNSIRGNLAAALRWLVEQRVDVDGLAEVISPSDCQRAYQGLLRHDWPTLGAVFDWTRL